MPKFKKPSEYARMRGEKPSDEMALKNKIVNDALERLANPPFIFNPEKNHSYETYKAEPNKMPLTNWTFDTMIALAVAMAGGTLLGMFGVGVYELARYGIPYLDRMVSTWIG